jgi:hypothetical protein
MMKFSRLAVSVFVFLTVLAIAASAQDRGEGPLDPAPPKGITPEEIIKKFAAHEKEFKAAREGYTYRQEVKVQTLDGDTVDGEYHMVTDILFNDQGRRLEQVVFAPQSSLRRVSMSREDYDDIRNQAPFVLTTDELAEYNILYVGQQQEDELHCYVFDVAPKPAAMAKGKRYFQGRIWVDDHDLQIVKTRGKGVSEETDKPKKKKKAEEEQLFPTFTTWRQQVDGVYWFPVFSRADETLHFKTEDVHIREIIKYENYKKFGSSVKITYEGQDVKKVPEERKPQ